MKGASSHRSSPYFSGLLSKGDQRVHKESYCVHTMGTEDFIEHAKPETYVDLSDLTFYSAIRKQTPLKRHLNLCPKRKFKATEQNLSSLTTRKDNPIAIVVAWHLNPRRDWSFSIQFLDNEHSLL